MTPEEIFGPLSKAIEEANYGYEAVFEYFGAAALGGQHLVAAAAFNARDFVIEQQGSLPSPTKVMQEIYWRTFFREDTARKYETAQMLDAGEEVLRQFVEYMVGSLKMDQSATAPGAGDGNLPTLFN